MSVLRKKSANIYGFPTGVGHCPGNWGYRLYQNRLEPTFLGANIFWEDRCVSMKIQCMDQGQQGVRAIISL